MGDETKLKYTVELGKTGSGGKDAAKELQDVDKAAAASGKSLDQLATRAKQAITALAGAAVIRAAVTEMIGFDNAVARLNGSLRAGGQFSQEYSRQLQKMAGEVSSNVKIFTDTQVMGVESVLVGFRAAREEMPRLTQIAVDAGAGLRNLEGAAAAVGAAVAGEFTPALRILKDVDLPESATRAEKLEIVLGALQARFKGMAAEMGATAGGELAQFRSALGDVEKELGRVFYNLGSPALKTFTAGLRSTADALQHNRAMVIAITDAIVTLGQAATVAAAAMVALRVSSAANVLFGAAAITNARDMAAALGLLAEKYTTVLKAAGVLGAGLLAFQIGKEGWLLGKDNATEEEATRRLGEAHARLAQLLREEITERVRLKALTESEGAALLARIRPGADLRGITNQLIPGGGGRPDSSANLDLAGAQRQLDELRRSQQLEAARNYGSEVFVPGLNAKRLGAGDMLTKQFEEQMSKIEEQRQKGLTDDQNYFEQRRQIEGAYHLAQAEIGRAGEEAQRDLGRIQMDRYAAEMERVREQYRQLEEVIGAYYDVLFERRKERGGPSMKSDLESIGRDRRSALDDLALRAKQAQYEVSFLGSTLVQVGEKGAQAFSSGLAGAMVQVASGTKGAKEAMSQFFASFMQQMAQMILQALILRAVQSIFAAASAPNVSGGAQGGWGALATGVAHAAQGAVLPRQMAVGGVQQVNSATYYPAFNTVAGEAGSEVLAVLSKPRFMQIGGLASYVGEVQGSKLAMTNAGDLQSAIGNRQSAVSGRIVVQVQGTRDFEVRLVDASVRGAVVEVVNGLHTDGEISSAVKGLTA